MIEEAKINDGLTSEQAAQRTLDGLSNVAVASPSKTVAQIWRSNLFTFYNFLNLILAVCVISTGSYRNLLFLGIVLANLFIGTIQELRAKRTVDRLSVLSAPKATALRDGKATVLKGEELVLDDIVILRAGDQLLADAVVVAGEAELNESLITGESDAILKHAGDELFSGSFVASGSCRARLTKVGADSYAARLTIEAKRDKSQNSVLKALMMSIIKFVSVFIIPTGLILFYNQFFVQGAPYADSMITTAAAVLGMIPDGLYLLTSLAFAVGVIRLGQRHTLVQQLYSMESLARADVLCLDKTGTITEGSMEVRELISLEGKADFEQENSLEHAAGARDDPFEHGEFFEHDAFLAQILSALAAALPADNATGAALAERFPAAGDWTPKRTVAFSSARKYSGADFGEHGAYVMGAPEFILRGGNAPVLERVNELARDGSRVLLVAKTRFDGDALADILPLGLVVLSDKLRPEVCETFKYFAEQDVAIKVISGDNPVAVSAVAMRAGVAGAKSYVDASTLSDEQLAAAAEGTTVFGRVSPAQKRVLIKALQKAGHTVAMTGDGVNDVLALKDADCSVAMASGADAARHVSQLVLMDSNFSAMPAVVLEGRRVINNIERAASLFLVKTAYSFTLSALHLFLPFAYPFVPIHLTLIGAVAIGIPGFFLALEPNDKRVRGSFIRGVLKKVIPGAATVVAGVLTAQILGAALGISPEQCSTVSVIYTGFSSLGVLLCSCMPLNRWRGLLVGLMTALFFGAVLMLSELFVLVPLGGSALALLIGMLPFALVQVFIRWWILRKAN